MQDVRYLLAEEEIITQRLSRFKYTCVATNSKWVAFGSPTGSIHVFNFDSLKHPHVISLADIATSVKMMSFSPSGSFLIAVEATEVSLVENPTTTSPSISSKPDVHGHEITAVCWLCDPPPKLLDRTTPFLCLGDSEGGIWIVSNGSTTLVGTVPSTVNQISLVSTSKNLIINASNSAYFLSDKYALTPIRSKRPNGCFGGLFVERFNAICFARAEGKLLLATPEGKSKVMLPLFQNGRPADIPESVNINLSILQMCGPFLVSTGKNSASLIVNLDAGKLDKYLYDESPFIDSSSSSERTVFMWKNKVVVMKVCETDEEYIEGLLEQKNYAVLQKIAIEKDMRDLELLEKFIDPNNENKEFNDHIEKVKFFLKPQPLSIVDEALYNELCEGEAPKTETINKVHDILDKLVIDEVVQNRIQLFVMEHPYEWKNWEDFLDYNKLIEVLNEKEATSIYAMEMANKGTSALAKILADIDTLPVDYCVANYPVIHSYNLYGSRRELFNELVKLGDVFATDVVDKECEQLDDSPYTTRVESDKEFTPEEAYKLLLESEWEDKLSDAVDELRSTIKEYFLTKGVAEVPSWVDDVMEGKRVQPSDGCGNWGAKSEMKECPICGMPLNTEDNTRNVALFPCAHAFHTSCLQSLPYCPVCYSLSLE